VPASEACGASLLLGRRLGGLVAIGLGRAGQLVEVRALLRELGLDHVGTLRHLSVRLGARVRVARALGLLRGALLARPRSPSAALGSSPSLK